MHSPGHTSAACTTAWRARLGTHARLPDAAGIVERLAGLGDVGDPVLELHEHVGTVVDAETVAGAQVLVDPHAHGGHLPSTASLAGCAASSPYPCSVLEPRAKQVPHRARPPDRRRADDPFEWLARPRRSRHGRLSRSRERLQRGLVRRAPRVDRRAVRGDQVTRAGDRHLGAGRRRRLVVRGPHRGGPVATRSTAVAARQRRQATRCSSTRTPRPRGHEFFDIGAFEINPDHTLLAWSADTDGDEHYTLRVRDLRTGIELADELARHARGPASAWSIDGTYLFYVEADEQERPYRVMRHRLGTPQRDRRRGLRRARRTLLRRHRRHPEQGVDRHPLRQQADRRRVGCSPPPIRRPPRVCVRPRRDDVEYHVDHWGDRLVILTNDDAVDFRVMTAPIDAPDEWTRADRPPSRAGGSPPIEPFADFLALHEWHARPAADPHHRSRRPRVGARHRRRTARRRVRTQRAMGRPRSCDSSTSRSRRRLA